MKVQLCNECGDPLGMCKGALCHKCRKFKRAQKLEPGSVARAIIAKRAARLMAMIAAPPAQTQDEQQQPVAVIVTLAADQLAKAWGARVAKP
jgi:hypothetical protein